MANNEYNTLNNIVCLCTNNNTLMVNLKLHHHNISPQNKTALMLYTIKQPFHLTHQC